jgi:hypothetical protein
VDPVLAKFYSFFPTKFTARCKVLDEYGLLVRRPALEALDCIRNVDWTKQQRPVKIVFYGKKGERKSNAAHFRRIHIVVAQGCCVVREAAERPIVVISIICTYFSQVRFATSRVLN